MATLQAMAQLLCFSLLLLNILSPPQLAIAKARKLSAKPGYQTFYTDASMRSKLRAELLAEAKITSTEEASTWVMDVIHRDSLPSSTRVTTSSSSEDTFTATLSQKLERDSARVTALTQRLEVALSGANTAEWQPASEQAMTQEEFSSPIKSGFSQGSGEYFTRFGVGSPAKEAYFVMDTGSDLSWTQCEPCDSCYKQTDPLFDPSKSSSYDPVSCSDALCSQLLVGGCRTTQCLYQVSYGDGSFTVGDFVVETITFAGNEGQRIAIGCGHNNQGLFVGASGLLGLGAGRLSFPSQIKQEFSYCLPDRFSSDSSQLIFGSGSVPSSSFFSPLLKNPRLGTFYYLDVQGISVGGTRLSISPSEFALQSTGNGGVIIDSGTSITRLVAPAYAALRDAFSAGASNLPSAGSFSLFDTCYALAGRTSVDIPTVSFLLAGGAAWELPASNILIQVDKAGTYCFGFAGTNSDFSIIGNMQQQGFRVSYNTAASRIGFAANQC